MSNLPKGWSDLKLGDICEFTQGVQIPFSEQIQEYKEGHIRYLYIRDFFSDKDKCYVEDIYPHKIMRKEDIMIVNTGNTAGSVYSGAEGVLSNNAFKLNFDSNNLNRDFLFQFLKSYIFDTYIKKLFNSAGQPHVGHKNIALVPIKLPPLEEQKKIADILSTVDKKIAFVEKNINATEELKKGLMQKLLTEGIGHTDFKDSELGRIPESWEVDIIENLATVVTGSKDTQNKVDNGNYPFFVRSDTVERINTYSFEGEAVLTSGDGVGVGKIFHYVNCKFDYHQRVYNIHNFKSNILGKYFYEFFKANFYSRVSRLSAKNSVDSVRREMITKMNILVPPLEEQKQIAEILSTVDNKLANLKEKKQSFEELKKGLMQKLLTGEVRV